MPDSAPSSPPPLEPGKAPLGIVKRTEEDFSDWIARESGFLTAFGQFDDKPMELEPYQVKFLDCTSPFRALEKSRQIGGSWIFGAETTARAHLREKYTGIFVSYNLADAKEKIVYVQQMHEALPLEYQKKIVVDSKLEIAFQSNSGKRTVSRIISNPSKAPRGKHGDIYLDELAHCLNDQEIYKGSTALIMRAEAGQLTICSTPMGRRGVFWEILRQEIRRYKGWWRQSVPWWLSQFLCKDILAASKGAPLLSTADRVAKYGNEKIQLQFDALLLEDFQQEYECVYSDESMTFFPYELILPCTSAELELCDDYADAFRKAKGRIVAGFDVGRRRDISVLTVWEEDERTHFKTMLMMKCFERMPFAAQESELKALCNILPVARLSIDSQGLGMQLAENLEAEFPEIVVREEFTQASKEIWCTDFKVALQKRQLEMPRNRDLTAQIHSIKKNVTVGGRVTFDAVRDSKGHADMFWSCALACRKERGELRAPGQVTARVFG